MKKKLLSLALIAGVLATGVFAGCGAKEEQGAQAPAASEAGSEVGSESTGNQVIKIAASPTPHAEILEHIKPLLEKQGYELEVKTFDDYSLLNPAVDEGSLDANFFQHVPYLEESIEAKGYDLDYTVKVHIEPMALYSKKVSDISEIADGAEIAVPNDPSNEARALKLLADNADLTKGDTILLLT